LGPIIPGGLIFRSHWRKASPSIGHSRRRVGGAGPLRPLHRRTCLLPRIRASTSSSTGRKYVLYRTPTYPNAPSSSTAARPRGAAGAVAAFQGLSLSPSRAVGPPTAPAGPEPSSPEPPPLFSLASLPPTSPRSPPRRQTPPRLPCPLAGPPRAPTAPTGMRPVAAPRVAS